MDFDLTDEQNRILTVAREVTASTVLPRAAETDRAGMWPAEIVAALGKSGLLGINVPAGYGGQGADGLACALVIEELSLACASSGAILSVHNSLCCDPISAFGTEPQKRGLLPALGRGAAFGTSALTQVPSEGKAWGLTAHVRPAERGFILNGSVRAVVGAAYADWILVLAPVTGSEVGTHSEALTAFVVSLASSGVRAGPAEPLVGARAAHVGAVHFDDCAVSATQVLGGVGAGMKVAQATLDSGRVAIAAQAVGIARAAFEESVKFAMTEPHSAAMARAGSQGDLLLLADMATEIDAARMLVWRAANLRTSGKSASAECSMAKVYATEMSTRVTHMAARMRGYSGIVAHAPSERHRRDAQVTEVFEGTSDIQRSVIASGLLGQ